MDDFNKIILLGLTLIILISSIILIERYQHSKSIKSKQSYIPIVIDSSKVALIHGQDTIYLYMDNAAILQEVPVLYLEQ